MRCRILTCLLLAWFGIFPTLAKVYLVSVGVADYPGTKSDLKSSANDARTIVRIYKAAGNVTTTLLLNKKGTKSAVLSAMKESFSKAQVDDTVILYFSGHGTNDGALFCYDGSLYYQQIFNVMKECHASKKIIIADACFSGKMRANKQQSMDFKNQEVMLFLSSRTEEYSFEAGYKNGLFTIYLERGLRGAADVNKDKVITARELYDFVHQGVISFTQKKQHPVMWGNFDRNMPVIKW